MPRELPIGWTDPEPAVDGSAIALPGPHPHTSADVEDWAGRVAERDGHGVPAGGLAAATTGTGTAQALSGPHPHESADFKEWAGQDETGDRTPPGRPGDPLNREAPPAAQPDAELV